MTYVEAIATGGRSAGTWMGEAQRVRLLAAELGVTLDEESLVYYDVREVMSLVDEHARDLIARRRTAGRDATISLS